MIQISRLVINTIFAIFILSVMATGCTDQEIKVEPANIDYLLETELLGAPTPELAFKPLDPEILEVKLDIETRKAIEFPRQGIILVKIPMVVEGGKFTCAVSGVTSVNTSLDCWFSFMRMTPSGVGEQLETVWVQDSDTPRWYYVEIDLSDYIGREIVVAIDSSIKSPEYQNYLANPMYKIPGETDPRRFMMICIDTLRTDKVGAYGAGSTLTPTLDQFAAESMRFANCQSASPWTFPSCASIVTGRFPGLMSADSVTENLRDEETTLAEIFFDAGFRTGAVINNTYVSDGVGMFQGYEFMYNKLRQDADRQFPAALEWLDLHMDEDFFLYIHIFDPHVPYSPPESYVSQYRQGSGQFTSEFDAPNEVRSGEIILTDDEKLQMEGLYNGEVAFADYELGKFFNELKTLGIYDDMSIVIFGDHGEEFWEHGAFEHGHSVYQEVVHVPLFMKIPGVEPSVYEGRMSLIDVLPTWLSWAGFEYPEAVTGRDLFAEQDDLDTRSLFIEDCIHATERRAVIQGDWKQILHFDGVGEPELYNLVEDPEETTNLFSARSDVGVPMMTELLMYSTRTSAGFHVRLYNFEDYWAPQKYQLAATVEGGQFSNIVHASEGVIINESLESDFIVVQVEFGTNGYISLDFDVTPEDALVTLAAEYTDDVEMSFDWYLGSSAEPETCYGIALTMLDESIAMSFPQARLTNSHGVYIWSIPGSIKDELASSLTPEQRAELDALGYVH